MMSFSNSVKTCLRKYKDFTGRASRSEFWWFYLFSFILSILLWGFDYLVGTANSGIFSGMFWLVFIPFYSVTVRRLHDVNWRGTLAYFEYAGIVLITLMDWLVPIPSDEQLEPEAALGLLLWLLPMLVTMLVILLIFLVLTLVLLVQNIRKGTDGPNRFGPDPLTQPTLQA